MVKKISLSTLVITAILITGCGGGSNKATDSNTNKVDNTAKDILKGNAFYYTDEDMDDSLGYYKDVFRDTTLSETEHKANNSIIDSFTSKISYSGKTITVNNDDKTMKCDVSEKNDYALLSCKNQGTLKLWRVQKDAKLHSPMRSKKVIVILKRAKRGLCESKAFRDGVSKDFTGVLTDEQSMNVMCSNYGKQNDKDCAIDDFTGPSTGDVACVVGLDGYANKTNSAKIINNNFLDDIETAYIQIAE